MFPENFYWYFITALIPLIVGFIWYNEKVFGTAWMKTNGFTKESLEGGNMAMIFGLSFIFGVLISFTMAGITIHQGGVAQTMMTTSESLAPGSPGAQEFNALMAKYGGNHRNFGHGALHGFFFSLFFVFPVIAINAMFERRGWKYIWIHVGYWTVCLTIIGAILCKMLSWAPL